LIVAGTKASNALRRRCAEMHILDPLRRCNLFDMLAKPILSYGCEIWGVNPKAGEKAELLHKSFLRNILRVPKPTSGVLVLAEFKRSIRSHGPWDGYAVPGTPGPTAHGRRSPSTLRRAGSLAKFGAPGGCVAMCSNHSPRDESAAQCPGRLSPARPVGL